jgi:hypothetical protein
LLAQLHKKYTWINNRVRGKKSIGLFQGTSTITTEKKTCINLITNYLTNQPAIYPIYSYYKTTQPLLAGYIANVYIIYYEPES